MISRPCYNSPTSYALLQVFIAMMDGEEMTLEYFTELTGFKRSIYIEVIHSLKDMLDDLSLSAKLQQYEIDKQTDKTQYREYKYKLIARTDFDFTLNPNLSDDLKKLYLPTILYLKLKNRQKVNLKNLQEYFPNYTKQMHSKTLNYMRNTIGEDLYKDEYKSYVIEEIE